MNKNLDQYRWRDPFRDINLFQQSLQNFFDDFNWRTPTTKSGSEFFAPSCEVEETESHYNFKFDLPGVTKDQIKIDLKDNVLTVAAERREEKKSDKSNRHISEVNYGSYMRSFTMPMNVDSERVEAKYESGVLQLSVPKISTAKARQITVK